MQYVCTYMYVYVYTRIHSQCNGLIYLHIREILCYVTVSVGKMSGGYSSLCSRRYGGASSVEFLLSLNIGDSFV